MLSGCQTAWILLRRRVTDPSCLHYDIIVVIGKLRVKGVIDFLSSKPLERLTFSSCLGEFNTLAPEPLFIRSNDLSVFGYISLIVNGNLR